MNRDPAAFVRAETVLTPVALVPEIRLHLAVESIPLWQRTEAELEADGLPPPFWAFAWAGGQALARYVLDHPETVRGKRVLDFASGSGLVAIAAAKAGAAQVRASDLDPFALAAITLNARANGVTVTATTDDLVGVADGFDVLLIGDAAYERDLATSVFGWVDGLVARGIDVLVGDPGRTYLPRERLDIVATYEVPVTRELEDFEIKRTSVWRPKIFARRDHREVGG